MPEINEQDTQTSLRYAEPDLPVVGDLAGGERKLSVSKAVEDFVSREHTPPDASDNQA